MTHALPICDFREESADSAFCFYLSNPYGSERPKTTDVHGQTRIRRLQSVGVPEIRG